MSTTTTRLGLYKTASDGSENVNVVTDLLNNWDALDLNFGFRSVTSSTRPGSPFTGQIIRESDTSRTLLWNGAAWIDVLNTQGVATSTVSVTTTGATAGAFATSATGTSSTGVVTIATNTAAKRAFDYRVTGDAVSRVRLDGSGTGGSGTITLGDGTTADVNLYRSAANTLATDDSLSVAGNLSVAGINGVTRARKTGDTTVTSNNVPAADPHLVVPVVANAVYEVEGVFFVSSASLTPDILLELDGPASSGGLWAVMGPPTSATTDDSTMRNIATSIGSSRSYGIQATSGTFALPLTGMLTTAGTAGNLTVAWSQATSNGTGTVMKTNSWIRLTRTA